MQAVLNGPFGSLPLSSSLVKIGRAMDNQLVLADLKVSSHHAEIRHDTQGYWMVDLDSTNGTYVNDQRLQQCVPSLLRHLDAIRVGETLCMFVVDASLPYTPTVYPASEQGDGDGRTTTATHLRAQVPSQAYRITQPLYSPATSTPDAQNRLVLAARLVAKYSFVRWLVGFVITGLVLAAILASGELATSWVALLGPSRTLHAYCDALKNQDYHAAYALFDNTTQKELSLSDFSTSMSNNGGMGKVASCSVSDMQATSTASSGSIHYIFVDQSTLASRYTLQKSGPDWKIGVAAAIGSTPHLMLTVYCSALHRHALAIAYAQLSQDARQTLSLATFTRLFNSSEVTGCNLTTVQINGLTASTIITYGKRDHHSGVYEAGLICENGGWKLNTQQPE
ncbi:MAG TPA: FHA domain-containing protein [Ktedonobacteraceae bacterium]|nr:FHA domain-containing protein [Ktedonobacteraceae bacterium]